MIDSEELNRLTRRDLPTTVAMEVVSGRLDEEFEVARWEAKRAATEWATDPANRSATFTPLWDYEPSRFYLALDGEKPDNVDVTTRTVMEVASTELHAALQHGSGRDSGPWSERYARKTATIAYRWAHDLPVTPLDLATQR